MNNTIQTSKLFHFLLIFLTIFLHHTTLPSWAKTTLNSLSLEEKIGQLFVVAATSLQEKNSYNIDTMDTEFLKKCPYQMDQQHIEMLIRDYHIGGIIFLGSGYPKQQVDLTNHYQQMSKHPLLIGQDFEWGLGMRLKNTISFPHNMTLGALKNESLIYEVGKEIGRQAKVLGVHINFAPVVDVSNNRKNPVINDRSFGDDPNAVAQKGLLFARGLQDAGILACAKHFPGHGDTDIDSHNALPCILHTRERIKQVELHPFIHLINNNIDAIMTAHLAIPSLEKNTHCPATLSHAITTDLLQKNLGFKGLVITDGLGMRALTNTYQPGEIELHALRAGNDILLCPVDVPHAVKLIKQALLDGIITQQELDHHFLKILQTKECLELPTKKPNSFNNTQLHTEYAYLLKKLLYQQTATLVKKNDTLFPLCTTKNCVALIIDTQKNNSFSQKLNSLGIPTHTLSPTADTNEVDVVFKKTTNTDTLIISMHALNKRDNISYGLSNALIESIKSISPTQNSILLLFGTPYSLKLLHTTALTIIVGYENDSDAHDAVLNILFGKKEAHGTLPINPY